MVTLPTLPSPYKSHLNHHLHIGPLFDGAKGPIKLYYHYIVLSDCHNPIVLVVLPATPNIWGNVFISTQSSIVEPSLPSSLPIVSQTLIS